MPLIAILSLVGMFANVIALIMVAALMLATHRTHEDRMKVVFAFQNRPVTYSALATALEKVPFNKHLRAHFLFRDPWLLYDPIIPDAVKNPHSEVITGMGFVEGPPPMVH